MTISTSVGSLLVLHILNCETSAEMWAKLESVYEQKSEASIHYLQQQFFNFVKDSDDNIATTISKLQSIVKQLKDMGEVISENMMITKILMCLPESYNHFFSFWEATEKAQRTLRNLVARLSMEESRLAFQASTSSAFAARRDQRFKLNHQRGKENEQRFSPNEKKPDSNKPKCHFCKKIGHFKRNCPNLKKERQKGISRRFYQ